MQCEGPSEGVWEKIMSVDEPKHQAGTFISLHQVLWLKMSQCGGIPLDYVTLARLNLFLCRHALEWL